MMLLLYFDWFALCLLLQLERINLSAAQTLRAAFIKVGAPAQMPPNHHPYTCPSVHPSICPSVHPSICPSIYPSIQMQGSFYLFRTFVPWLRRQAGRRSHSLSHTTQSQGEFLCIFKRGQLISQKKTPPTNNNRRIIQ